MTAGLDGITRIEGGGSGSTWVELAVSAYADIATAVSSIGATPATLVIDSPETVSTALVVPSTLFLRIAKGASLTKSGSGTITFQGLGLDSPDHKQPIFFGFAAGDVTWSGTVYPHELSTEWWDTANSSLQDRYNRADLAVVGKYCRIKAYPRTITTATAITGENHHLYLTAGDYPNTCATYGASNWPPFLMKNNSSIIGEPGNRVHESSVNANGWLIYAWHIRSGGGESTDGQEGLVVEGLNIIGDPTMVETSGSNSCVLLGNVTDGGIRKCRFEYTKAYAAVLGLYGTTGNHAFRSEIADCEFVGCGSQILVLLNAKGCQIVRNKCWQQDSSGVSSYAVVDIEPNLAEDVMEDILIADNEIDCRDVTDGSKYVAAMAVQAAISGSMKNITIRDNRIFGANIYPQPTDFAPLTTGISVFGALGLNIHDNEVRGAFQRAYTLDRCRYVQAYDNHGMQNATATGDGAAMYVQAVADSNIHENVFDESPHPATQATGILEAEKDHFVTTSGSTVTNQFVFGTLYLFFDLYVGLTVTVNNTDYTVSSFTSHTIITTSTSIGTLAVKTFVDANVTTGTENIAITSHGHNTGSKVYLSTTGAVPTGLTANRYYYIIRVDANNLKLADTLALALAGTPVNITAAGGGGTHSLTPVLTTKFSNSEYWGNKASFVTLTGSDQSRVHNSYDSNPQDYIAPAHSLALGSITSIPVDTILGCTTEVVIDPITPRDDVGISITGADNLQTKTAAGSSWDSGAFSYESILADGVLETTAIETNKDRMIGLSFADVGGRHYNTIEYACYLSAGGSLQGYALGTGSGSTPGYSAGGVITLSRIGTTIEIALNGAAAFHTFTSVPAGPLYVKTSFGSSGGTLGGIVLRGTGDVEALSASEVSGVLSGYVDTKLATVAGVNMNTATATTLYTCPTGKSCVITKVIVRNASTSLTTASYSFGWNSAAFNNVIADATHVELTGSTLFTILPSKIGATVGLTTGVFKVLLNTLQGGAATTTMDVFGFTF